MHQSVPDVLDAFVKWGIIVGWCLWMIAYFWKNRGQWHELRKVRVTLDAPTIGVLVCMALFWVLLIGARFWGGGMPTMAVMSFLVLFATAFIYWGRSA
jgi:hypothetical protein